MTTREETEEKPTVETTAAAPEEEKKEEESWTVSNGTLSVACHDLTAVPEGLGARFGAETRVLDLSFNALTTLEHLEGFGRVETLVADNNALASAQPGLAALAGSLRVLSVNNNAIDDLDAFLDALESLKELRILSMLKNPVSPSMFFGGDSDDYARFRLYVVHRLRRLELLDTQPVTPKERAEAIRRGVLLKVAKPAAAPAEGAFDAATAAAAAGGASGGADQQEQDVAGLSQQMAAPGKSGPVKFGVCSYVYYGKQSEGNRFILNEDL